MKGKSTTLTITLKIVCALAIWRGNKADVLLTRAVKALMKGRKSSTPNTLMRICAIEARREALDRRNDASKPVIHVPMFAPSKIAIAAGSVMALLMPMATTRPVTAELLCTMAVVTIPARIPAGMFFPINANHVATIGAWASTLSASDIRFIPRKSTPNPRMISPYSRQPLPRTNSANTKPKAINRKQRSPTLNATIWAVNVVPISCPIITPMACCNVIKLALIKPIIVTISRLLLWIRAVATAPKSAPLMGLFVIRSSQTWI